MRVPWLMGSTLASMMAMTGIVIAQGTPAAQDPPALDILLDRIYAGMAIEQFIAQQLSPLRAADRDDDGLDQADVVLANERRRAEGRASRISRTLRYDLDGDFKVRRAEMIRAASGESDTIDRIVDNEFEELDFDGDEVITLAEASDVADDERFDRPLDALLALDPNRDGRLTAAELGQLSEAVFNSVDGDRNGKISTDEQRAVSARTQAVQIMRSVPVCDLPALPPRAQLVAFGGYEGDSVASVAIGGSEQETNLIDVVIEPGAAPLYLVLTSYESMVWRLTGAVDRVANVVVSSFTSVRVRPGTTRPATGGALTGRRIAFSTPNALRGKISASGVIGIPARRVTIARPGCLNYFSGNEAAATRVMRATLQRSLGREPDAIFGQYSVQKVALPSGSVIQAKSERSPLPRGFEPQMWADAVRFWPGGLVAVDPRQVVAGTSVERYRVLPSQMGLAQLIGAGAIRRLPNGRLLIVRPIAHMPPSMGGSHSVTLQLAPGVPMPPGDPVHSCVIRADGSSTGATCPQKSD